MARTSHPSARLTRSSQDKASPSTPHAIDRSHLPPPGQTTPAFCAGQQVDVQLRTYIWVPGTVLRADYHARYGNVVYEIQYVAADGSRRREGFFPKDVRRMNAKDAL
ncbi:hypothetical protein BD309DRAFT_948637 [Dichomitus squalens]|nr:hypothetical protein BD309DRAFT_948637 [Dichomitus squalens]